MDHIEFSISRLRILWDVDREDPEFFAEVAYLYDQIVQTGSHEPIIYMGMKLEIPFADVGHVVSQAMEAMYISTPKRGSYGGTITNKARKVLGQPIVNPKPRNPSRKKGLAGH